MKKTKSRIASFALLLLISVSVSDAAWLSTFFSANELDETVGVGYFNFNALASEQASSATGYFNGLSITGTSPAAGNLFLTPTTAKPYFASLGGILLSTSNNIYNLSSDPINHSKMSITDFATGYGTFNSALTFSVAAVPEPETYAMMLLGIGLVGFVARRKA
ncbi:MAG: PEP-CTERM sorting domain-containing protein [Methylophilaceae bacterium]